MPTNLKILGWTAKGLRCPDHEISFEKENDVYKVSLVQMPNGTGKTTTLMLLRAALTGPEIWDDNFEKVSHFRKSTAVSSGNFILRLLHNGKRLTIEMLLDFDANEYAYKTTKVGGKENGFHPPIELRPFLSAEFIKLLVFNGELAEQLLNPKHTNAQKAIEEMYQLSFFTKMKERIDNYWMERAQDAGSKGGPKELSRRKTKVDNLTLRIPMVRRCLAEDKKKLQGIKDNLKHLQEEFKQQFAKSEKDSQELADANKRLQEVKNLLASRVKDLATLIKNPMDFSQRIASDIISLKESLDRAKLPGAAAREFFDEIAEEPICICGREITEEIRLAIKAGAQKYLGSEQMNVLNAMKTDIRNRSENEEKPGILIETVFKQVEELQDREMLARQNLDFITQNAAQNNPEIASIHDKISALENAQALLSQKMFRYTENNDTDESWNPDILDRRKKKAIEDLAETTGTIELKRKKDILSIILDKAFSKSLTFLSAHICEEANMKIQKIMPHNKIAIEKIDRSLRLVGKEGGSVGETLSVGYAYLSTLLSNKEQNLPSVVDSPTGSIDLRIRPGIGKLIPHIADQFIAFTISSERDKFLEPLTKELKEPINLITLFKKGDPELEALAKQQKNAIETDDGFLIIGREFFELFHTEKEN